MVGAVTELLTDDTPAELETRVMARVEELRKIGFTPRRLPSQMKHRVGYLVIVYE